MNYIPQYILWLFTVLFLAVPSVCTAESADSIGLLDAWQQPASVSSSRLPRPVSQVAENITVITAADIKAINAHTLSDILATVPGIQIESQRTPGSVAYLRLQGSSFKHIQVLLDGIPFNNLSDNFSDIGLIPARIIERIEIIKGSASYAWGQALGGVINVITKAPERDRIVGGQLSGSWGTARTSDSGLELSGTSGRLGYYLSGGYSSSDGLLPNNHGQFSNGYAKLTYDLSARTLFQGTVGITRGNRGDFAFAPYDLKEDTFPRQLFSSFSLQKSMTDKLQLELSGHYASKRNLIELGQLSDSTLIRRLGANEKVSGGTAKVLWKTGSNTLALGGEAEKVSLVQNDSILQVDTLDRTATRWGVYANDTLILGSLAISPGVRFDHTGTSASQVSSSFGITWQVNQSTLLRAYTARGYSLPSIQLDTPAEKVWTSQIGVESTAIPQLWVKGTLFRNNTWDITVVDQATGQFHTERQLKQGYEVEVKTGRYLNANVTAGYSFVDAREADTRKIIKDIPPHTVHAGLQYDDLQYLKAVLNGRHIWWNAADYHNGSYHGIVVDLHLTATPFGRKLLMPEIFFSLHNLSNSSQYLDEFFKNAGRWVEGGVRMSF